MYCKMFLFLDHYHSHCTQSPVTFKIHFDSLHNTAFISYHLFSFGKSIKEYIIHMYMVIIIFIGIKG